ncbi:MotA/TolQ/ExbB proton channel family protein [uncultured Salinisphaera sp.]|uniref:MotA/TolQ/ExbB proton channel family protein n=1 Tax=uncultured Salinisphaera sp. TaxID=359372 RepID=UPI0032B1972E
MNSLLDAISGAAGIIALGGPVVVLLLLMSLVAITIVLAKIFQFRRVRINDRRTARNALELYRGGNASAAVTSAKRSPNPTARTLARAIELRQRSGVAEGILREDILQYGGDMLESLRSHLRPLEVIAALAPLLGLLGTVLGMIEAFRDLEQAGSQVDPAVLSGGIWQALLTTAVGLAVAMPVIVALNWLERTVDRCAHEMDSVVTRVFTADLTRSTSAATARDDDHEHSKRTPFV